jgi:hypothetical protein
MRNANAILPINYKLGPLASMISPHIPLISHSVVGKRVESELRVELK